MPKGYSKIILVNEYAIPTRGASAVLTHSDLNVMAMAAVLECTETQWRELLASVGLRVVKIWQREIEVELLRMRGERLR